MTTIGDHSWQESLKFRDAVREVLKECITLETATQRLAEALFAEFQESIVLVRCFITVPYAALPDANQKFVDSLARDKGITAEITDEVPVLSLLGTSGVQDSWNDRRLSKGHIGIPLVSVSFVESIPMIARLLKELDVKLEWLNNVESMGLSEKELGGGWIGTFYVREAATATDHQGRFIIPAQGFVAENQIKTVFGLGGIYPQGNLLTLIVFTRDLIEKDSLGEFTPLIPLIAANTSHLIRTGEIFH